MPMQLFSKTISSIPLLCRLLAAGQVIAAPTETAYALLVDATNTKAVKKVFAIKGRNKDKVSALLVVNLAMAKEYARFSSLALKLARCYWPGPLTLVLPAKKRLSSLIIKNKYVGMRVPKHKWLLKLLTKFNKPLTATSANLTGGPNLYSCKEVKKQLTKKGLKFLVDSGRLPKKKVSTIVKVINNKLILLRPGAISLSKKLIEKN